MLILSISLNNLSGSTMCSIIQRPGLRIESSRYCFKHARGESVSQFMTDDVLYFLFVVGDEHAVRNKLAIHACAIGGQLDAVLRFFPVGVMRNLARRT